MEKCSKIVAQYRIANITKKRVNVFVSTLTQTFTDKRVNTAIVNQYLLN